ncbi:hypothetical protein OCU04_002087 [Sclerotinia nivalis]|uniref:BTB domain-containing protein n=1 Tax=Sclerotinia nivalis TaxID=352851 RepID=A0A9X0AZF2_9HELO|nr:hypothetical protein OCU04_002087 [Sclerotinia nivalis]
MTRISGANFIADPDGDLLILLGPITPPISKTGESTFHERNSIWAYDSRVLVSSKDMSLASPVFKIMLEGSFKESLELKTMGSLTLPLPEDDPVAMRILIDLIHGHGDCVPKVVHIHVFTALAILADYYQCSAVAEVCANLWKRKIVELSLWKRSETRLACWIYVTWVFNLSVEFEEATGSIVRQFPYGLGEIIARNQLELPIPTTVIKKVDEYRQAALEGVIGILDVTLSRFQGDNLECPVVRHMLSIRPGNPGRASAELTHARRTMYDHGKECDAEVLEYFTKTLSTYSLFPLPRNPEDYRDWVFDKLIEKVHSVEVNNGSCIRIRSHQKAVIDDTLEKLRVSVADIDRETFGLDMASLKVHFNV